MGVNANCYPCHLLFGKHTPLRKEHVHHLLLSSLLYRASCPHVLPGGHWADPPNPHSVDVNEFSPTITRRKVSQDAILMGRSPLPVWIGLPETLRGCGAEA